MHSGFQKDESYIGERFSDEALLFHRQRVEMVMREVII